MIKKPITLELKRGDRSALRDLVADGNTAQKIAKRARIVLLTAEGHGTTAIMRAVGVSKTTVWRWQVFCRGRRWRPHQGSLQAARQEAAERGGPSQDRREDDEGTSRQRHPLERPHDGGGDGRQPH